MSLDTLPSLSSLCSYLPRQNINSHREYRNSKAKRVSKTLSRETNSTFVFIIKQLIYPSRFSFYLFQQNHLEVQISSRLASFRSVHSSWCSHSNDEEFETNRTNNWSKIITLCIHRSELVSVVSAQFHFASMKLQRRMTTNITVVKQFTWTQ